MTLKTAKETSEQERQSDQLESAENLPHSIPAKSLDYEGRCDREDQLWNARANPQTVNWIWDSPFAEWASGAEGLVWICGKPASGKSTLMECITRSDKLQDHLRRGVSRNWTIFHHFVFNFGLNKDIRNNFEGFPRSLLYQLTRRSHGVKAGMDTRAVDSLETKPDYRWTLRALQEQLGVVLEQLSNPLCILLDGLDEYQGDKWDMANFLLETATSQVKLCIASRPDMVFEIAFKNTPTIKMQEWNSPAID